MKTPKKNIADELIAAMTEAVAIARGEAEPARLHVAPAVDVRVVRKRLGLSQAAFARRFCLSAASIRDWEQGRRRPDPAARVLLRVIERDPEAVERALA